jgi:DNA invertase Pin-like site-specific DNA recombinase
MANASTNGMARAVGYVRVSTEEQAQLGVSLEAQERAVRCYCEMRGLELVELIRDEGVSAGKPLASRTGGERVLAAIRRREASAVVAWKLDRLFRDCGDCLAVTRDWDRRNVSLHLVDLGGQAVDTASAMGRFFLTVMAGAAELERNQIRERTSAAMRHKADLGEYTGGEAPYGYRVEGDRVAVDASEQTVIALASELRAAGLSYRRIAAELAARGLAPRRGGAWHPQTVANLLRAA